MWGVGKAAEKSGESCGGGFVAGIIASVEDWQRAESFPFRIVELTREGESAPGAESKDKASTAERGDHFVEKSGLVDDGVRKRFRDVLRQVVGGALVTFDLTNVDDEGVAGNAEPFGRDDAVA